MNTTTAVVPFYFQDHEVRTIDIDGEPWFVAKDVCDILGLESVTKSLLRVPDNHKGVNPIHTLGGIQQINTVDEPGLYRLVLRSDKPEAEPFMEWVTAEVLPSIRKTGSYALPGHAINHDDVITLQAENLDLHRKYAAVLEEKIALLEFHKEKRTNRTLTDADEAEILAMVASGMSQHAVAKAVSRSSATVSYLVRNKLREVQP